MARVEKDIMQEMNNGKTDARTVRTRRDLGNALVELMQEKNFDDISTKDITDRALVAKNTFYNNFSDKNELLDFVMKRYEEELLEKSEPVIRTYNVMFRATFFKKMIREFTTYISNMDLPVKKIISNDKSHAFYWALTAFTYSFFDELNEKCKGLFDSHIESFVAKTFFAGGFANFVYSYFLNNEKYNKRKLDDDLFRLCSPTLSLI